ncbi:MAG: hypothetical protein IT287_00770 [Bdellovibrionaceae bacterium]|nr:hypothetical protein [Pseudobdellovibrionaceae bacterium]
MTIANNRIKKGVAEALDVSTRTFNHSVDIWIHDIPFRFCVTSEEVIQRLYDIYPLDWFKTQTSSEVEPHVVYWLNNEDFGFTDAQWEDNESYECLLYESQSRHFAIQRDFLGIEEKNHAVLVCSYVIGDGFYNFLRWLAPKYFIRTNKLLLHSSCVLDSHKQAYFCFGPSGAGKTTIASLVPRSRVLGDDMNVLKIENGRCWAQAGALGQAITNPKEYNQWHPVVGFFWLQKNPNIFIENIQKSEQFLKLTSAVANVFWPTLKPEETQKIFTSIQSILNIIELQKLNFSIDREVWPTVWSHFLTEKENHNVL